MKTLIPALAALSFASAVFAAPPVVGPRGVLTDPDGMTLYVYDHDPIGSGKSKCNDSCAERWIPMAATPEDVAKAPYTIITRTDGTRQWAYKGRPLYRWSEDKKPGDLKGDGIGKAWHSAFTRAKP